MTMSIQLATFSRASGARRLAGLLLSCAALLATAPPSIASEAIESLDQLRQIAEDFLAEQAASTGGGEIRIEVGQLDTRLRLQRCADLPRAELAPGARTLGNTTVRLSCSNPAAWSIFVQARIEQHTDVVVVARPISRQQIIGQADLQLKHMETSSLLSGYYDRIESVVGLEARRALPPGQVVTSALVASRPLIQRGQLVTLYSGHAGLGVRMRGEALEDGALGDSIRVRNPSSQRVVEGYVEAGGIVRVPF